MSLTSVFKPYFSIGAAVPDRAFENQKALEHIRKEFGSITCENDMKPENLLDREKNQAEPDRYDRNPALNFSGIRQYLDFARENGLKMRGHTLLWHSQTPDWFFRKNYETDAGR